MNAGIDNPTKPIALIHNIRQLILWQKLAAADDFEINVRLIEFFLHDAHFVLQIYKLTPA